MSNKTNIERTLTARLKCLTESRSMSWCDRIGSLSSGPTTIPGPSVAGPPANSITRAPVLGKQVCTSHSISAFSTQRGQRSRRLTSNNPTATLKATPVLLKGLLSLATDQASLWRFSKMLVSWNSHCWTGIKNLLAAKPAAPGGTDCPGRGVGLEDGLRPNMSWICFGAYSFDPRNT